MRVVLAVGPVLLAMTLLGAVGCGDENGSESTSTPTPTSTVRPTVSGTVSIVPSAMLSTSATPSATPSHIDTASGVVTPTLAPTPVPMDFSVNLNRFAFRRDSGLGFCPAREAVLRGTIQRGNDGIYRVNLTVLAPTASTEPACIPDEAFPDECANEMILPERALTAAELQATVTGLHAVLLFHGPDPKCTNTAFDPCVITSFEWRLAVGDPSGTDLLLFNASDDPCVTNQRLPPAESVRLAALFEMLR